MLGTILPDTPLFIAGVIHLARGGAIRNAYGTIMTKVWVRSLDNWTHSLMVVAALFLVAVLTKNFYAKVFAWGWALHFGIDFLTHTDDAAPPLWPLSQWSFRSPVSYWQWQYFSRPFTIVTSVIIFSLLYFWWRDKRRI